MKNKTNEVKLPGFVKAIAMVLVTIAGIAFIVWFSIITTSIVIYLAAVAFIIFLMFLAVDLISWIPGKALAIIFILAVAYLLFR